jgi:hypothetical protein
MMRMLLIKQIICSSYFKRFKSPSKVLNTKTLWFWLESVIKELLLLIIWQQNIPFIIRDLDSKCNRSSLDYSFIKIFKNNADLESNFLHYIAENSRQVIYSWFHSAGWSIKSKPILSNGWWFDISLSFQNIRKKSLYEAVEIIISKFCHKLTKGGGAYVHIFLISFLNETCETRQELLIFEFWDKNASKFSIPSQRGIMQYVSWPFINRKVKFPVVLFRLQKKITVKRTKDKLWLGSGGGFWFTESTGG